MNVLLVRSSEYAITPALPRFAEVLSRILPASSVHALCWRTDPRVVTPVPSTGVSVVHYERRASSRSISGIFAMPLWWLRIWQELFRLRPALVQTSDVFSLLPVMLLRPFLRYKVIADVRDHVGSIASEWGWKAVVLGKLESALLKLADKVVLVEETRRELIPAEVSRNGKVVIVRNVPSADFRSGDVVPDGDFLTINYSGYLSAVRGADMLMDAVARVERCRLEVIGDIPDPELRKRVEASPTVDRRARMSHRDAMARMEASDAIALLYDPAMIANRYAAPNKFYEAMMIGRPVITADGIPVADWVREHDCGYVVKYGDTDELARVLRSMRERRDRWQAKAANARKLYESRFTWLAESASLEQAYRAILGR